MAPMKNILTLLALAPLAWAAPSSPGFVVQNGGAFVATDPAVTFESLSHPRQLPSLSLEDFTYIGRIKHTISSAIGLVSSFGPPPPPGQDEHPDDHGIIDFSEYTIPEILAAALSHHPDSETAEVSRWKLPWPRREPKEPKDLPLHRLGWLVDHSPEAKEALGAEGITLLAPDDCALTRRHEHHGHKHHGHKHHDREMKEARDMSEVEREQPMEHPFLDGELSAQAEAFDGDDDDDEERKKRLAKIVAFLLKYHTLPVAENAYELANHSTLATTLKSGRDTDEPLRIHVEPTFVVHPFPHPSLKFNFYATKRGWTILAKNGVIHLISAPLLPPLSPLNKLFLFPQIFSTLTSDLQKVDLADEILPPHKKDDDVAADKLQEIINELTRETDRQWTVFAPTNWAFNRLGFKIVALLHSPLPISRRVLKYVLAYHLVPDITFYSDYILNKTEDSSALAGYAVKQEIDVDVPLHLLLSRSPEIAHPQPPHPRGFRALLAKLPLFGRSEGPGHPGPPHRHHGPPPPHGPPGPPHEHPGPPHGHPGPPPPPHGGPHGEPHGGPDGGPHGHHGSHKANLTHYVLPTLLSTSGVNENATLHVVVASYRLFGRGPVRRAIIVLPPKKHHHHHDHEGEEEGDDSESFQTLLEGPKAKGCHGNGPRATKVWKSDIVARNGAIHAVGEILRPPYHHHHHDDKDELAPHDTLFENALAELFA